MAKSTLCCHKADVRFVVEHIPDCARNSVGNLRRGLLVLNWTMANDTAILSTASSFLDDIVTHNASNTDFRADLTTSIWKWVWPLLCVTGLVGNTLVLLVLRRDGLARTSANVFLTALAIGDTMGLLVASVVSYPHFDKPPSTLFIYFYNNMFLQLIINIIIIV